MGMQCNYEAAAFSQKDKSITYFKYNQHLFPLQDLIPIFAHHGQCHDSRHILRISHGLHCYAVLHGIPDRPAIVHGMDGILHR